MPIHVFKLESPLSIHSSYLFQVSDKEVLWTMRICIIVVGVLASVLAISVTSIYALFYLCADLSYCILLPQFICVVHVRGVNTYGSFAGYVFGLFFRMSGGEILLGFPPLITYPWYDDEWGQLFPYKTLTFLISLSTIMFVSWIAHCFFARKYTGRDLEYKLMMMTTPAVIDLDEDEVKVRSNDFVMISYRQSKDCNNS